jgi:hypothetical protein
MIHNVLQYLLMISFLSFFNQLLCSNRSYSYCIVMNIFETYLMVFFERKVQIIWINVNLLYVNILSSYQFAFIKIHRNWHFQNLVPDMMVCIDEPHAKQEAWASVCRCAHSARRQGTDLTNILLSCTTRVIGCYLEIFSIGFRIFGFYNMLFFNEA